jgi:hypothetical protein
MRVVGVTRAALLGWMIAMLASTAHALDAEVIGARLRVEPGATCLTEAQLVTAIEPLLDDPRIPEELTFVVEGDALDPLSAQLYVVRRGQTVAERAFAPGPERCGHFHAAVGLAIALAINAAQEEERARSGVWSIAGAGLWTYRVLPRFAPGAELLARRALGAHALVRGGVAAALSFDERLGTQGTFDATLAVARLDGCARIELSSALRADGCAGVLGGLLQVSGNDVARPSGDAVPWVALAAAASLELAFSEQWALALGFSANFLLHRVEVGLESTDGTQAATRALDRVGLALGIGPVYYF